MTIRLELTKIRLELVRDLGFMAFRSLLTVNAGAFIVVLTFVGNVPKATKFSLDLHQIKLGLFCFLSALAVLVLAMAITYLSAQLHLVRKSLPLAKNATGHIVWMIVPPLLSFFLFVTGSYLSIAAIEPTPAEITSQAS